MFKGCRDELNQYLTESLHPEKNDLQVVLRYVETLNNADFQIAQTKKVIESIKGFSDRFGKREVEKKYFDAVKYMQDKMCLAEVEKYNSILDEVVKAVKKVSQSFENEKGEYYSIKHSFGPIAMDDGTGATRIVDNSRIYLNSRYEISEASDTPLQLGIYNKDLHLNVWINYNTNSQSFELDAYEDEEKGRSQGILKSALDSGFNGQIKEEDIREYNVSGWFEKEEFVSNIEDMLYILRIALESDFSEMDEDVSWEGLGFINWGAKNHDPVDEAKAVLAEFIKNNGIYYPDEEIHFLKKYYEELSAYVRADLRIIYNTEVRIVTVSSEYKADSIQFVIENLSLSTNVVVYYNSETGDFDFRASEILPYGETRVIIQGTLWDYLHGFEDKLSFVQPENSSLHDFKDNARLLANLLRSCIEEMFNEMNNGLSLESLGIDYWF